MAELTGDELAMKKGLQRAGPLLFLMAGTRVLMLSGFPEERYALAMIRNGADGYLCKDCSRDELLQAIRTVAQGRRYVSARTARRR